jgi:hypothetical protein
LSEATGAAGVIFACPASDGDGLAGAGLTITVTVRNNAGVGIPGIPAADISLTGCSPGDLIKLCGGSGAINASGPTDANGVTTITGDIAAGGCDLGGVRVVVQGIAIGAGNCGDPCVPVKVKSTDLVADLKIQVNDLAKFSGAYQPIGGTYDECMDYVAPFGAIQVNDLAKFSGHYTPLGTNHDCL